MGAEVFEVLDFLEVDPSKDNDLVGKLFVSGPRTRTFILEILISSPARAAS